MDESLRIVVAWSDWLLRHMPSVPVFVKLARVTDFYDRPGGYKEHHRSTPYLGGMAVVSGFLFASFIFADALADFRVPALCALVMMVVGTIDDRVNLGITRGSSSKSGSR